MFLSFYNVNIAISFFPYHTTFSSVFSGVDSQLTQPVGEIKWVPTCVIVVWSSTIPY